MSDFDGYDDELAAALRGRAGRAGSVAAAHDAVLRRSSAIRRRRAAVAGGGAMTVLVIGAVALFPRAAGDSIAPADTGDVMPSVESTDDEGSTTTAPIDGAGPTTTGDRVAPHPSDASTTTPSSTASATTVIATTTTVAAPPVVTPSSTAPPATAATTLPTLPSTAPTTTPTTSGSTAPTTSPSTTDPAPVLAPFTETYDSSGGSITVNWNGSSFSLLDVNPVVGYDAEIEDNSATRVRVRFRGDTADARIEVRVNDGELVVVIS